MITKEESHVFDNPKQGQCYKVLTSKGCIIIKDADTLFKVNDIVGKSWKKDEKMKFLKGEEINRMTCEEVDCPD